MGKQGVDDLLAKGHTLDDLRNLATEDVPDVGQQPAGIPGQDALGYWRWGGEGLFSKDGRGAETLRLNVPLRPLEILGTPEGRQLLHLQLSIGINWRDVYLDDTWVGRRNTDAARELGEYGVPLTGKETYILQQFVAEALRSNVFPTQKAYRTLGWHRGQLCAPSLDTSLLVPSPGFDWLEGYRLAEASEQDARRAWQHVLEMGECAPVIYVTVGAALGAPVLNSLPRIQHISFTVHFHSPSTGSGKTTMLDLGAATNGDPARLVRTWDGTKVGLETTLGTLRHFALFLNELADARAGIPAEVVMMLTEEKGRQRGAASGGLRPGYEWRTVVVSSGNSPIAAGSAHHSRRILSIPVSLPGEEYACECQHISQTYFGYPLKWCQNMYQTQGLIERINELAACYEQFYQGELAPLRPQAYSWALVEAGARMLLAALGMPEEQAHTGILRIASLSAARRQSEGINYVQRIVDIIQEAVARDPAGFGASIAYDKPRQGNKGRALKQDGSEEWTGAAILPGYLQELAQKAGLPDLTGILIEAREQGILKTDKDRSRLTKTVRIGESLVKCYVFEYPDSPVTTTGNNDDANFEAGVTTCYHQPVFVTTVTTKNKPYIYIKDSNVVTGGNGGNRKNTNTNTNTKSVTTCVTTRDEHVVTDSRSEPAYPCRCCGSQTWWRRADGEWLCGRCHPEPPK
jgi:hypothetical protein